MPAPSAIERAALDFIAEAFAQLHEECVIPTPRVNPFVTAGRDYAGPTILGLPTCQALDSALVAAHPERFGEQVPLHDRRVPFSYTFALLEACVARCSTDRSFTAESPAVSKSIEEFEGLLQHQHAGNGGLPQLVQLT